MKHIFTRVVLLSSIFTIILYVCISSGCDTSISIQRQEQHSNLIREATIGQTIKTIIIEKQNVHIFFENGSVLLISNPGSNFIRTKIYASEQAEINLPESDYNIY